ncbi:hypothetical protein [Paraburkholderia sp. EG304]|uniref:hypothetical protein n=1 Tax=Paraburkholderia sp. EG304 TaxID=3237015 RepID=UPI00397A34A9
MQTDTLDPNAAREARDLAMQTTFLKAYDLAEQLTDLYRASSPGEAVAIPYELLTRAATMLAFCAGFAGGSVQCPPINWRRTDQGSAV